MVKRNRLEIIKDILEIIRKNGEIRSTPLLRQSNLSTTRFKEYYSDLIGKGFVVEKTNGNVRVIRVSEKGLRFLERYRSIVGFIEEFEL